MYVYIYIYTYVYLYTCVAFVCCPLVSLELKSCDVLPTPVTQPVWIDASMRANAKVKPSRSLSESLRDFPLHWL